MFPLIKKKKKLKIFTFAKIALCVCFAENLYSGSRHPELCEVPHQAPSWERHSAFGVKPPDL